MEKLYEVSTQIVTQVFAESGEEAVKMVREAVNKGLDDELATDAMFFSTLAEETVA